MLSRAIRVLSVPEALPCAAALSAGLALLALYFAPPPPPAEPASAWVNLPAAPTGVAAGLENGRIRLSWAASAGAAAYAVYCGAYPGGESAQPLLTVPGAARSALVPFTSPGLAQFCRLRATRDGLASLPSDEVGVP